MRHIFLTLGLLLALSSCGGENNQAIENIEESVESYNDSLNDAYTYDPNELPDQYSLGDMGGMMKGIMDQWIEDAYREGENQARERRGEARDYSHVFDKYGMTEDEFFLFYDVMQTYEANIDPNRDEDSQYDEIIAKIAPKYEAAPEELNEFINQYLISYLHIYDEIAEDIE